MSDDRERHHQSLTELEEVSLLRLAAISGDVLQMIQKVNDAVISYSKQGSMFCNTREQRGREASHPLTRTTPLHEVEAVLRRWCLIDEPPVPVIESQCLKSWTKPTRSWFRCSLSCHVYFAAIQSCTAS